MVNPIPSHVSPQPRSEKTDTMAGGAREKYMRALSSLRWAHWHHHSHNNAQTRYRLWLAFTLSLLLALLGYATLLVFPVLSIGLFLSLLDQIPQANTLSTGIFAGLTALAAALSGLFAWQVLRMRPAPPVGPILDPGLTPSLHQRIDTLAAALDTRPPEHICLTDRYVLRLIPTPRYGLPWAMHYTLQLGLPLLECLNPAHVDILLARCLGRRSAHHSTLPVRLNHWLSALRPLWSYYRYRGQSTWPLRPVLHAFFAMFEPLYTWLSLGVAQRSEGDADRYALDVYNDRDVLEALVADALARHFLQTRFWPAYLAQADRQTCPSGYPYQAMGRTMRREPRARLQSWLDSAMAATGPVCGSIQPPLAQRLEGIGHVRAWLPGFAETSAAARYLGAALPELRCQVGRDWLGHILPAWRQRHARARQEWTLLKSLQARARHTPLSAEEAWRCARLADRHLGRQQALPLYRAIAQRHPDQARLQYAVGRMLIGMRDPAGLKALERAMHLEPTLRAPIRRLIAQTIGQRPPTPAARLDARTA